MTFVPGEVVPHFDVVRGETFVEGAIAGVVGDNGIGRGQYCAAFTSG